MSLPFNKIKTELCLNDTMPFGKYLGLTLSRVVSDDPNYMKWLLKNSEMFFIDDTVHELLEKQDVIDRPYGQHWGGTLSHMVDNDLEWLEDDIPF